MNANRKLGILHLMSNDWQQELRRSVTHVADLLRELKLDADAPPSVQEIQNFPLRVPRPYLARIRKGDTGACAIHCRYCFRRHFPYAEHALGRDLDAALSYIARNPDVEEVILSGGDPLSLINTRLIELCRHIEDIIHVRRIRLHTRLPIVVPSRLDDKLYEWLNRRRENYAGRYLVVFHINHPAKISADVERATARLTAPTLLNQAVLLKGVNDDTRTLADLSRRCFDNGILPYYLHLLDHVQGAAHFEVSETRARLDAGSRGIAAGLSRSQARAR